MDTTREIPMRSETRVVPTPAAAPAPLLPPTTMAWIFLVAAALFAFLFGIYSYAQEFHHETIATNLRNPGHGGASWGLYIVFVIFFVGVSFAGITVAAICRLFDVAALRPITRMAELLTIASLLAGASCVLADLGRPEHGLLKLPRLANPTSPFYGTFTLVMSGYLFSSLVYFFLAGRADAAALAAKPSLPGRFLYRLWASGYKDTPVQRARHHRISFWLALTILPLLVTAHSTLGFIFGIQSGRPGWYSALQAPSFVVLAGVSGTGMLILVALGFRRLYRLGDQIPDTAIRWLGNFLWILSLVYLYLVIVEELTTTYTGLESGRHIAHEIVSGRFAPVFWTTIGCLLLAFVFPFVLFLRKRGSVAWIGVAAALANVAAICKRFLIVVPSQTHGALMPIDEPTIYLPSWSELGVVAGLFGLVAFIMLVFGRFFPFVPSAHPHATVKPTAGFKRRFAAFATMLIALGLVVFGLTDSFRLWRPDEVDPVVPFAPVIFASGVMLLFVSAVIYELFPDKNPTAREVWNTDQRRRAKSLGLVFFRAPTRESHLSRPENRAHAAKLLRLAGLVNEAIRRGDRAGADAHLREIKTIVDGLVGTESTTALREATKHAS
ncbi:MAG: polysulfide reductase NrfD [Deltaproteobacteria bacterium]|nr:polysulfide reductase NrfD [Deltaproteobacteria bacterium]